MLLQLITTDELAKTLGYSGANSAFREWCVSLRITPVPGRRGYYDPKLVRRRLDEAQNLYDAASTPSLGTQGLVAQRRARLASQ